ncbi:hypothetical protein PR048_001425 [Dryococelus australis]|uniref:Reverse transcriptase n=1 Tax=Dryococelus australis TaxID=614101 RepID=A0ABQ9IHC0_9NEOP|nr:hypothetical protein PR048_001425 [Dryococelus australis]
MSLTNNGTLAGKGIPNLHPSPAMDFTMPTSWEAWKRRFERDHGRVLNVSDGVERRQNDILKFSTLEHSRKVEIPLEFPHLTKGLGKMKGQVTIVLKENPKSYKQSVPRVVAIPLLGKLKTELNSLIQLDIIEQVMESTEWVAPIVV